MENLNALNSLTENFSASDTMPVIFIGHGSPMNAVEDNPFTKTLSQLSTKIQKPNAILVISAHWLTRGNSLVSLNPNPQTIYDFGGFPDELYNIKYEPKGAPEFAKEIISKVTTEKIMGHDTMGLDHGAWTILKYIYPEANIPVFQLSIDYDKSPQWHFNLAKQLSFLRKKGVLILSSGNIVHNLRIIDWNRDAKVADWSLEFDSIFKKQMLSENFSSLIDYYSLGSSAKLAIPTNDHYLPALYTLGLKEKNETISHIYEGFQNSTVSMRSFLIGK
ncbi:MAG: 4,5-DOPA dioxygenase extradiol [Bacteroidia bacterium]|nr:4,5-DOPA dioxygenase extradiol [Bacteroidia bacterium]